MPAEKNDELIFKHPVLADLRDISEIDRVKIKHADFNTGCIIVTIDGEDISFEGVMRSLRFVDLLEKMEVQAVDFETGEITVRWHPKGAPKMYAHLNISQAEIDSIKAGNKIYAIKLARARTGLGLADAKKLIEDAADELRRRGLL